VTRKKRILFGSVDIGYRIDHYSQFIKENFSDRLEAESFSKYVLPSSHFKTSYTYTCEIYKKTKIYVYLYTFCFFIYALFRYDIFHFLSGELILTRKLRRFELWTYRKLGKKVIMHFVGADIRSDQYLDWKRVNMIEYLNGKENPYPLSLSYQQALIQDARKYADNILVSTPDLLEIIPEAKYIPVFLNIKNIPPVKQRDKNERVSILFSPSSHRTKGSEYVHEVLNTINKKYIDKVDIVLPGLKLAGDKFYAMTRYNLLEAFQKVDIIIDQMIIGWYGLKAVEAVYSGCKVVCYIEPKYSNYQFENTPILSANVLTLQSALEDIIENRLKDESYSASFDWIEKNHFIEAYKDYFYKIWIKN
jgi:hypothetical protein